MYYKKKKVFKGVPLSKVKILLLNKEYGIRGCWRFERSYQMIGGEYLHQKWAIGEGEVVRHLCGDNRCVNPLHIIRGSDIENAMDEIEIRKVAVRLLEELLNENYESYGIDVSILVLLARASRIRKDMFNNNIKEAAKYTREYYRTEYEKVNAVKYTDTEVSSVSEKLKWLASRYDVNLINI